MAALQAEQEAQAAEIAALKEQLAAAGSSAPAEERDCPTEPPATVDYRAVPHRGPTGEPDGYRLSAIRSQSWLACNGLKNGDIVMRSHGEPLRDREVLFEALRADPSTWDLDLMRRGQPAHVP